MKSEARFFVGESAVALVHGSLISNCNVVRAVTGTVTLELKLHGPPGSLAGLPDRADVELCVEDNGIQHRLARVSIDYWDAQFGEHDDNIELQGRGPLRTLIDSRWHEHFHGELSELVRIACASRCKLVLHDVPQRLVDVYVNSASVYGALRLLSVSTALVVSEETDDSAVVVRSVREARRDLLTRPIATITKSDIRNASVHRGMRIKRRGESQSE